MNILRNLKIIESNNISVKSFSNKLFLSRYQNPIKINSSISSLKPSKFQIINKNTNKYNLNCNSLFNKQTEFNYTTKRSFSTFAKEITIDNLNENSTEYKENNSSFDVINFNYLYSLSSNSDEANVDNILAKFNDLKILTSIKKRKLSNPIKETDLDKKLAEKNLLYVAYIDVNKRLPLRDQYSLEAFESNIKTKFFKDLNTRNKSDSYISKISTEELNNKIDSFTNAYVKDDLLSFTNNLSLYMQSLEKETKAKFNEFYFVKFTEELNSLTKYLKSLFNYEENNYYSDSLYNINNKVIIRLINEIEIIVIETLGKASGFTAEVIKINESIIYNALHKYKIFDFSQEQNLHFKSTNFTSLLEQYNENIFKDDLIVKSLVPYITNAISVLIKQYGEDSVELSKYYFILSYLNLKLKNFEKAEEYVEKSYGIYTKKKKTLQDENTREYLLNEISHSEYLFIKSQLVGVFQPNKKDSFLILKQASDLVEDIETKYFKLITSKYNNNINEQFCLEKEYNFSALKFKINYNLYIYYKQYNFIMDAQSSLEKSLRINSYALKSNKSLMSQFNLASKLLIEIYENLNINKNIFDIAKRNFNLSYYIINDENEKSDLMKFYAEKIIENINFSFDKFNLPNMLNSKKPSFVYYKKSQENFILSLISFYQKDQYNFTVGAILNEYLEYINNTLLLTEETYENSFHLINSYYSNIYSKMGNYSEAVKNLIKIRDQLELNEFLDDVFSKLKIKNNANKEKEDQQRVDDLNKASEDKFYLYRENEEVLKKWIHLAIAVNYNIIINQIKSNDYEEALENIHYLLKFINRLNENKSFGNVIEHPYLLVNLNLIAAHYHLIKNQKIYSVKYLKEVNSMITKFDWVSKDKINSYLTEMVNLINTI